MPKLSVFTVDDSEIVYKNMGLFLKEHKEIEWLGHAFSLPDAFIDIKEKKPNIVILDIHLKEGTSFDLLKHINEQYPSTTVIMFTNLSTTPYRNKCVELGAKYFLDKSTEFEKLPQIIENLINPNN